MTQPSRPSAGAMRAASKIWLNVGRQGKDEWITQAGYIIDRETGMAELLEAAQWTRDTLRAMVSDHMIEKEVRGLLLVRCNKLEQAISKCEGKGSEDK